MDSTWQVLKPNYPFKTEEPQGLLIGNDLIQFSGYTDAFTNATNLTYARDVTVLNSPWRRMENVPVDWGITHVATVGVGTKVYLCGGYEGRSGGGARCDLLRLRSLKSSGHWAMVNSTQASPWW
jgi:hypothetical protein